MTETLANGGLALALIGVLVKIWTESTKQTDKIIDVVKQNAVAMSSLENVVKENTRVTMATGRSTKELTAANKSLADKISHVVRNNN